MSGAKCREKKSGEKCREKNARRKMSKSQEKIMRHKNLAKLVRLPGEVASVSLFTQGFDPPLTAVIMAKNMEIQNFIIWKTKNFVIWGILILSIF